MRKIVLKVDKKHSALQDAAIVLDQSKQQMIFILLFTVLYLFRDLTDVKIPDIAFTGLCAAAFILADMGTSLGMYIFTSALTVPHHEIRFVYLLIILGKMFVSGVVQMDGKMLIMTLGLMLLQLLNITMFSSNVVGDVIYDYSTRMLVFVLPLFWYRDEYAAEDFRSALMCYVLGVMLGGTVTMILAAEGLSWDVLLEGKANYRLGKTYGANGDMQTTYNANQLATMFAIAVAVILQHMDKKRINKLVGVLLVGYSLFLIILTRSRTGLLMTVMAVLIYYLVLVFRRKKILRGFLLLGVVVAAFFTVASIFPGLMELALGRFQDQEDITNGRLDISIFYIKQWVDNPWCFFFGYGMGSFFDAIGVGVSPHNAITDILISWGLTGLLLVAGIIFMCYGKGSKNISKQDRVVAILPAVVALVASMAGQYLTTGFPHMRLCLLFLAAKAWETNADTKKLNLR